jgi:hypothetical protein
MTDDLRTRCPDLTYLLGAYVLGDGTLADEVGTFTAGEGVERADRTAGQAQQLLDDPSVTDGQLDAYVLAHSSRYLGSGRATLTQVVEALRAAVASPPAPAAPGAAGPAAPVPGAAPAGPTTLPVEVHERLAAWLVDAGLIPPRDYVGWDIADAGDGRWVLTPPGYSGVIFAVTPEVIRPIRPAFESVPQALAELGIN